MEEAEAKIKYLTDELMNVERLKQEIEALLYNKDTQINEWKCRYEKNEMEISDLKKYNKVVIERLSQMESSLPTRNTESLDFEYIKFQSLQKQIEEMSSNFQVIEEKHSKLLCENGKLEKVQTNFEAIVREVNLEKTGFEKQSVELNEMLTILLERNQTLTKENKDLKSKVRDFEKFDTNDSCRKELVIEKRDLESKLFALSQEIHSKSLQLEEAIIENKSTRNALQEKITALLVMTSHSSDVEKARDDCIARLQNTKKELKTIESAKNALQKELSSCHSLIKQSTEENARKYILLEQKLERYTNELQQVRSLYQKCHLENDSLHAKIVKLSKINEHQYRLLTDFNGMVEERAQTNNEVQKLVKESEYLFNDMMNFAEIMKRTANRLKYLEVTKTYIEQKFFLVEADNENLRGAMQKSTQEYDVKAQELSELDDTVRKLIRENESLSTQNATLLEKLDSKTKEVDDLRLLLENTEFNLRGANKSFELLSLQVLCRLERLKEKNKNLKTENNTFLESNREKLEFLKQVETRVMPVAKEMEHLKRSNEELVSINNNMKKELENRLRTELRLESINSKLDQAVRQLENETEISGENDKLLDPQNKSLAHHPQSEKLDDRKSVPIEFVDVDILKNNEIKLINEMEKLHNQNRILRLEVDKLIVHVEQFSDSENSNFRSEKMRDIRLKEDSSRKNSILENLQAQKIALTVEADPVTKENHEFILASSEVLLELVNAKIHNKAENLEDEEVLCEKETVIDEEEATIQSQLRTISSKNDLLSTENEQLRESLKSLEFDYSAMRKKLDEAEEAHTERIMELKLLDCQIQEGRKREDLLLSQLKTLNVKLVEESERISILQRTHSTQLQKQFEINKSLESRIHDYENREKSEAWKSLNTEQPTKLEVSKSDDFSPMKTEMIDTTNGKMIEQFQTKKDDLQRGRMTLNEKIDNISHILNRGGSDIDNLRHHFRMLKDEHQKVIQFENEWENQFNVLLFSKNERANRKCDQFAMVNPEITNESSLEDEQKHIELLSENSPTSNRQMSIMTSSPFAEKVQSLISGEPDAESSMGKEINAIHHPHQEKLESMEMSEKPSKLHVKSTEENVGCISTEIRNRIVPSEIVLEEKLQDDTKKCNKLVKEVFHSSSSNVTNEEKIRKGIFSRIFVLVDGQTNLRILIQQHNRVPIWLQFSACLVCFFIMIYCLINFLS